MDYSIKKPLFGTTTVAFSCEACSEPLEAPLEDAGTQQPCPRCGTIFITPGTEELEKQRNAERLQKEQEEAERRNREIGESQKRHEKEREAIVEQEIKQQVQQPRLVWYGAMHCDACGYSWQARRNTPPARCPSCSKRDVHPVKEPERVRGGCTTVLVLFVSLVGLACWIIGSHRIY
jgi:DNA-directed RNA polymerase subunit RPC12/RpoP